MITPRRVQVKDAIVFLQPLNRLKYCGAHSGGLQVGHIFMAKIMPSPIGHNYFRR
jgi:hypothetical protein